MPSKCFCCASLDSMQHCFFTCNFANNFWGYFNSLLYLGWNFNVPFSEFLQQCWSPPKRANTQLHRLLPSAVCQSIWRCRCALIFDGRQPELQIVLRDVMQFLQHTTSLKPLLLTHAQHHHLGAVPFLSCKPIQWRAFTVKWHLLHTASFCLNVDGSPHGNLGNTVEAFVVQDVRGIMLHAFSFFVGL